MVYCKSNLAEGKKGDLYLHELQCSYGGIPLEKPPVFFRWPCTVQQESDQEQLAMRSRAEVRSLEWILYLVC